VVVYCKRFAKDMMSMSLVVCRCRCRCSSSCRTLLSSMFRHLLLIEFQNYGMNMMRNVSVIVLLGYCFVLRAIDCNYKIVDSPIL